MGLCIQKLSLQGDHREMNSPNLIKNLEAGFVWIVGRRQPTTDPKEKADWHIQGVATTEDIAIAMCVDETYFIGPLPLNTALPHKTIEWVGLYFPLRP